MYNVIFVNSFIAVYLQLHIFITLKRKILINDKDNSNNNSHNDDDDDTDDDYYYYYYYHHH